MRSRYSAYAAGDADYVWRTWHPRTRPEQVDLDPSITWTRLELLEAGDDTVEFRAHHSRGVLHERSRFEQRAGRWFYVDGEITQPSR
jgi:SEC-C motif-containing protein